MIFSYEYMEKNKNPHRFISRKCTNMYGMRNWIQENIGISRDKCMIWSQGHLMEVHIKNEEDAMAFRLRWT